MLANRNTPISGCQYSPAQLLFNRRLRDKLPINPNLLEPQIPTNARDQLLQCQKTHKYFYDRKTRPLIPLNTGHSVRYWKNNKWQLATVLSKYAILWSYNIVTENGSTLKRNRFHLQKTQEKQPLVVSSEDDSSSQTISNRQDNLPKESSISTDNFQQPQSTDNCQQPQITRKLRPRENIEKPIMFDD